MGDGWLGWAANVICILWTLFVCVIFAMPNYLPVTSENMNYASVPRSSTGDAKASQELVEKVEGA
ncbi:hypothetical protein PHLCEN_2v6825 [Hermanssonia centrifuga]|uniref:Uncharacterized protein n=1 Tax=Hermanssonia centrifuga TaxID=98765 RepID=A0A2R6NYB7_9APHY|nr:hypothetical protein PHLCEN_2v6825 [Hermanssonia centrifuga]